MNCTGVSNDHKQVDELNAKTRIVQNVVIINHMNQRQAKDKPLFISRQITNLILVHGASYIL